MRGLPVPAVLVLLLTACGGHTVDWNAPENLLLHEESARKDDAVELDYWSLVYSPCRAVYDALADVEHYPDFVPGVDRVQVLGVDGDTQTVQIAQHVIGRQSNAKVRWTFRPAQREITFTTLASDLNYNDGRYVLEASPDDRHCLVKSTFLVKPGAGMAQPLPIGVLASGTREAFLAAAEGVRKRAGSAAR
jgi:hypothetical protein